MVTPNSVKLMIRSKGGAPARNFFDALGFRDEEYDAEQLREVLTMVRVEQEDIDELADRMDEVEGLSIRSALTTLEKIASNSATKDQENQREALVQRLPFDGVDAPEKFTKIT